MGKKSSIGKSRGERPNLETALAPLEVILFPIAPVGFEVFGKGGSLEGERARHDDFRLDTRAGPLKSDSAATR
jgi:hypothetical protein